MFLGIGRRRRARAALAARRARALGLLREILGAEEPYILDGRWSWFVPAQGGEPRPIDITFIDRALCVMIYAGAAPAGTGAPCSDATFLRGFCRAHRIGLLEIYPDAPLTRENLDLLLALMDIDP